MTRIRSARAIAAFVAALSLYTTGCASLQLGRASVRVWYLSDPPGAMVYWRGQQLPAPIWVRLPTPRPWTACARAEPVKVRWVSGAEVDVSALDLCPASGREQQFTVFRPKGVPGVELDALYAAALLQSRVAAPAPVAPPVIAPPRQCTTTVIGNQVFTNCT